MKLNGDKLRGYAGRYDTTRYDYVPKRDAKRSERPSATRRHYSEKTVTQSERVNVADIVRAIDRNTMALNAVCNVLDGIAKNMQSRNELVDDVIMGLIFDNVEEISDDDFDENGGFFMNEPDDDFDGLDENDDVDYIPLVDETLANRSSDEHPDSSWESVNGSPTENPES